MFAAPKLVISLVILELASLVHIVSTGCCRDGEMNTD
jgi:hypothetical protein